MKTTTKIIAMATFAIANAVLSAPAAAQVFKCVGQDGKTSFQQTPCTESQQQSKVVLPGQQWERFHIKRRPDGLDYLTFVDMTRIVDEGPYKRVFLRRDWQYKGELQESVISEELFDCVQGRSKILVYKGDKRREPNDYWYILDGEWDTPGRAQSLKETVCVKN